MFFHVLKEMINETLERGQGATSTKCQNNSNQCQKDSHSWLCLTACFSSITDGKYPKICGLNTEEDRLVSYTLVKNPFKVETLRTFASRATLSPHWSSPQRCQGNHLGEVCHFFLKICKSLYKGPASLWSIQTLQPASLMRTIGQLVMLSVSFGLVSIGFSYLLIGLRWISSQQWQPGQ